MAGCWHVGDAVWLKQDFAILWLSWEPRIIYIVIYKRIACKTEYPYYENILWYRGIHVIYTNAVIPIALYKPHNGPQNFFWDLIHLTHGMVGDALDDV